MNICLFFTATIPPSVIAAIAWIVWGIVAVLALHLILQFILFRTTTHIQSSCDRGGDHFFGLSALILLTALLLTAVLPISKFHLLWSAPLGMLSPFFRMEWHRLRSSGPVAQMMKHHLEEESGGEVWSFWEMRRLFKVYEVESPTQFAETVSGPNFEFWWIAKEPGVGVVRVIRRADEVKGHLFFKDDPRFYFGWSADDKAAEDETAEEIPDAADGFDDP